MPDRPNQLWSIKRRAWKAVRGGINSPAVQELPRPSDGRGSKYAATASEIGAMLERAGFVPRTLEIRAFTTVFRDVAQIIDLLQATTYGDLVPAASAADYVAFAGTLEALFAGEYPDRVSNDGIRLERYVLLAVADKPR